jgi:hypothetical protein
MRKAANTQRERKPLKLNVTEAALRRMVEVKHREGHRGLSETLEYLLESEGAKSPAKGRNPGDRG